MKEHLPLATQEISRRHFLKLSALAGAAFFAASCSSDSIATEPTHPDTVATSPQTTERAPVTSVKEQPTTTAKEHIVITPDTTEVEKPKFNEPPVVERVANKKFASLRFDATGSPLDTVTYDLATETPNDPAGPELNVGVGWEWHYGLAVQPGQKGNAVIFGHRTSHGARFREIDTLDESTAKIAVTYENGQSYNFRVVEEVIVDESDAVAIYTPPQSLADPELRMVTLYACHPEGESKQRILVRAVSDESSL